MHQAIRSSVGKTLLFLCTSLLVPAVAPAAPQPLHFLSDQFGIVTEKIPVAVLNDHLERIPECQLYFEYRHPSVQRIFVPMPKRIPTPKRPNPRVPDSRGVK